MSNVTSGGVVHAPDYWYQTVHCVDTWCHLVLRLSSSVLSSHPLGRSSRRRVNCLMCLVEETRRSP